MIYLFIYNLFTTLAHYNAYTNILTPQILQITVLNSKNSVSKWPYLALVSSHYFLPWCTSCALQVWKTYHAVCRRPRSRLPPLPSTHQLAGSSDSGCEHPVLVSCARPWLCSHEGWKRIRPPHSCWWISCSRQLVETYSMGKERGH